MAQKLDLQQAKKAVTALFKYNEKKSTDNMLDDDEENGIYVHVETHKIMNKAQLKLKRVSLPVSPYPEGMECCYITKDSEEGMEDKIKNSPIKKVISVNTLKTVYKSFESKRKLVQSYDKFVIEDRIAHLIPSICGKEFIKRNKVPLPIKSTGSLKTNVDKVLKATYIKLNNGLLNRVLIGNFGMSEKDVLKNYEAAVPEIVKAVAHDWAQVQVLGIKSESSPLLPIYTSFPQEEAVKKTEDKKANAIKKKGKEEEKKEEKKEVKKEEKKAVEKKAVEKKAVEKKAVEKKVVEKKAAEKKVVVEKKAVVEEKAAPAAKKTRIRKKVAAKKAKKA